MSVEEDNETPLCVSGPRHVHQNQSNVPRLGLEVSMLDGSASWRRSRKLADTCRRRSAESANISALREHTRKTSALRQSALLATRHSCTGETDWRPRRTRGMEVALHQTRSAQETDDSDEECSLDELRFLDWSSSGKVWRISTKVN